jgi:hypothetical protein
MNNKQLILTGFTLKEAIIRCGELQLPYEQTVYLAGSLHPIDKKQLFSDLQTPGTNEYEWYQSGVAEGVLNLNINLEANVADPKAKDAYKHLAAERRRLAISKKVKELFGI